MWVEVNLNGVLADLSELRSTGLARRCQRMCAHIAREWRSKELRFLDINASAALVGA